MDTDIFLARCESLDDGLHDLVNECYDSLTEAIDDEEKQRLVLLAKEKITLFNDLTADVEYAPHKEEIKCFNRYINHLKKFVQEV